jgi:hypothetical protein
MDARRAPECISNAHLPDQPTYLRYSKRLDYSRKDIANAALRLDYRWRIRFDIELAS